MCILPIAVLLQMSGGGSALKVDTDTNRSTKGKTETKPKTASQKIFSKNLKKPLDKPHKVWYNIRVVREWELQVHFKKNLKKLKKRLDKSLQICYNKYVIKRDYKANY